MIEERLPTTLEVMEALEEAPMQEDELMVDAPEPEAVSDMMDGTDGPVIQTPIIVSETSGSSNLVDDTIQAVVTNPLVQGVIAGALLLVLLVTKYLKGRKEKTTEEEESGETIEESMLNEPVDTTGIIIPTADDIDEDETPVNVSKMEEEQPGDDFAATLAGVPSVAADDDDEDEFSKTAIISANDMSAMDISAEETSEEQDETLDEVDVYLAYSLFETAEELIKDKLSESPDRADYRAKLLDTYFATQNKGAFLEEASSLKSLGDAATKYWPRVQTMGFELDPENEMFKEGEGGDTTMLSITKPEVADFDIGAEEEEDISGFDLSLDGDDTNFNLNEPSDSEEIGELEFNLDDDLSVDEKGSEPSSADNSLPDDLDAGLDFNFDENDTFSENEADLSDVSKADDDIDDSLEFNLDEDLLESLSTEDDADKTEIIEVDSLEFDVDELEIGPDDDDILDISIDDVEPDIDISDDDLEIEIESDNENEMVHTIAFSSLSGSEVETAEELSEDDEIKLDLDLADIEVADIDLPLDDSEDVSIELESLEEEIDLDISSDNADEIESELEPDLEIDLDSVAEFTEELVIPDIDLGITDDDEDITDIGNIEGLMLPDDVDEVATKLDLAKAFHDMGDSEGARSSLEEVLIDGNDEQKAEAEALLKEMAD